MPISPNTQPCPTCGSLDVNTSYVMTAVVVRYYDHTGAFTGREFSENDDGEVLWIEHECSECGDNWQSKQSHAA